MTGWLSHAIAYGPALTVVAVAGFAGVLAAGARRERTHRPFDWSVDA